MGTTDPEKSSYYMTGGRNYNKKDAPTQAHMMMEAMHSSEMLVLAY
jgi:hypothetical protein